MGEHEQSLAKQAIRAGQPIPSRIADAPELHIGLELFINAFLDLDTERQAGYSVGPIPWSKIKEYCEAHSFDAELSDDMFYFIKALDNSHLKRLAAKAEAASKSKGKGR